MRLFCYLLGMIFSGFALSLGSENPKFWPFVIIATIWGCTAIVLDAVSDVRKAS